MVMLGLYWGNIRGIFGLYWDYTETRENKMETTI